MQHSSYFTLEEANNLLPWLRRQLGQIGAADQTVQRLQEQLESLSSGLRTNGHGDVEALTASARRALDEAARRLTILAQEVADRNILLRDAERGLVDFPAIRDGREVYLCWLLGEDRIRFWHGVDTGFAGRQPL